MGAPRSWTLLVRRRGARTERWLECPRCRGHIAITEAQLEGRERIRCIADRCGWNDLADLATFKE